MARPRYLSVLPPAAAVALLTYAVVNLKSTLHLFGLDSTAESVTIGQRAMGTALGVALGWLCVKLVDVFLWQAMVERRTGLAAPRLLVASVRVAIVLIVACVVVARVYDQPLTGLLVSSGMIGIVLGFALQRTLADFFSGIALNADRSFRIGDWIDVDGTAGRVVEINWRAAQLVRLDHVTVILPNSYIAERRMLNYSLPKSWFRTEVPVDLEFGVPVGDAKRVLLAAIRATAGVLPEPAPDVLTWEFGDDGVRYVCRFYIATYADINIVHDRVASSICHHLYQAGLRVAYPKRDVYHAPMPARELDRERDRAALIGRIDLLHDLAPEELAQLAGAMTERRYSAEDRVVRQGEAGSALYVVVDGLLDVRVDAEGHSTKVAQLQPGEFFGESSLLTGEPRSATVVAVTESTLYEIDREALAPILQNRPELARTLSRALADRKEKTRARVRHAEGPKPIEQDRNLASDLLHRIQTFFRLND